ncbi:hypothetical protein JCM8097_005299 [Rhodosporidiobolus ruineniae]
MARPSAHPFSASRASVLDDDPEEQDPDSSFTSDGSDAALLLPSSRRDDEDEKGELPFSRKDLKHTAMEEEEDRQGRRRRGVKAGVMVLVAVLLSAALYAGSSYIPWRGVGTAAAVAAEEAAVEEEQPRSDPLLTRTPSNASSFLDRPADWNPLFPKKTLDYDRDLFIEHLRPSINASAPSSLIFHCRHPDLSLCAPAYRVLLVGPTIVSPLYTQNRVLDEEGRRVEVEFEVRDPGEYQVYAWPEHDTCDQWNHGEGRPHHQLAVMGTPAPLSVVGSAPPDSPRACTLDDDLTDGRWISKSYIAPEHHSPTSPYFSWLESHRLHPAQYTPRPSPGLTDYSKYGYVLAPYACKPHHHSFREWLDLVQPERLVVFGDSVMRDMFCLEYGAGEEVCKYEMFGGYEQSDKYIPVLLSSGLTAHLHFHWNPLGSASPLSAFLAALETPPSHMFFNVALWLTREDPDAKSYRERMRPLLEVLQRQAEKGTKVVARTSAGMVQAIACYDLWRIQRRILEPANTALLSLLQSFPSITPLDVYPLYNARPDASQDGRHWERLPTEGSDDEVVRPEEGALGYAGTDLIFGRWAMEKAQEERDRDRTEEGV